MRKPYYNRRPPNARMRCQTCGAQFQGMTQETKMWIHGRMQNYMHISWWRALS